MKTTRKNRKSGMSLTEIMMAMALLATAFIPIVGVMGTSMKATDKDDRTIKAVNICQERLNQALQFPFGILEPGAKATKTYGSTSAETIDSSAATNKIVLKVGPDSVNGFDCHVILEVKDRPGTFKVPMYDPFEKANNEGDPTKWGWSDEDKDYEGMIYQYTMTVKWKDKGDNKEKEYSLSTFKSKVRE